MLEAVFTNVLEISIVTGIIILIIAKSFPKLQKRYTVRFRKILWMILAVRLLIPYNYTLPNTPIRLFDTSKVVVQDGFSISVREKKDVLPPESSSDADSNKNTEGAREVKDSETALKLPLLAWIAVIWAVGALISVRKDYIYYHYFLKHCEDETEITEGHLYEKLKTVCRETGMKEIPQLYCVPEVETPMILGLLTPYMVVPERNFSEQEWRMAFLHECMHYQKHDLLYKRIIAFAASMYWFHPAVRYMKRIAFRDVELVCDQAVTSRMDHIEKKQYGAMLLKIASRTGKEINWSTAFFGSKDIVKERIGNIFDTAPKKRGILPAAVVLMLLLSGSLVFACGNPAPAKAAKEIAVEKQGVRLTLLNAEGSDYGFYIRLKVDIPRAYILTGSAKFENVLVGTDTPVSIGSVPVTAENECQGICLISYQGNDYRDWSSETVSLQFQELVLDRMKSIDMQIDMTVDLTKPQTPSMDGESEAAAEYTPPKWFQKELDADAGRREETFSRNDLRCYICPAEKTNARLLFNGNDVAAVRWERQELILKPSCDIPEVPEGVTMILYLGEHQIFAAESTGETVHALSEENGQKKLVFPSRPGTKQGFFYAYLKEKGLLAE